MGCLERYFIEVIDGDDDYSDSRAEALDRAVDHFRKECEQHGLHLKIVEDYNLLVCPECGIVGVDRETINDLSE